MKISPSNQTLILAGERLGAAGAAGKTPSSGSTLQRVTIVASQPDSVVYLRADYSSAAAAPGTYRGRSVGAGLLIDNGRPQSASRDAGSALLRQSQGPELQSAPLQTYSGSRDAYGNILTSSRDTGISSHLRPVEQYARTQRLPANSGAARYLDVLA